MRAPRARPTHGLLVIMTAERAATSEDREAKMNQLSAIYEHIPHGRTKERLEGTAPPPPKVNDERVGINGKLGLFITTIVGTMWAAYLFTRARADQLPIRNRQRQQASSSSPGSPRPSSSWSSCRLSSSARTSRRKRPTSAPRRPTRTPRPCCMRLCRFRRTSPPRTTPSRCRSPSSRSSSPSYAALVAADDYGVAVDAGAPAEACCAASNTARCCLAGCSQHSAK